LHFIAPSFALNLFLKNERQSIRALPVPVLAGAQFAGKIGGFAVFFAAPESSHVIPLPGRTKCPEHSVRFAIQFRMRIPKL